MINEWFFEVPETKVTGTLISGFCIETSKLVDPLCIDFVEQEAKRGTLSIIVLENETVVPLKRIPSFVTTKLYVMSSLYLVKKKFLG